MGSMDANDCRPGTKLVLNGEPYNVVERSHHKPGKGGAFVRFRLKNIIHGRVLEHTVRSGTKMETADVSVRTMQYLYHDGTNFVFMDAETYEQTQIDGDLLGFATHFLQENAEVDVTLYEGKPIGVQLPQKMEFTVVETIDNPAMGNTATNVTKDARIETGYVVQVPPFIKTGERIRILTEDGSYLERA